MGETKRPVAAQTNAASKGEERRYAAAAIATPPLNTMTSMRSISADDGVRCARMMAAWSA
jgi:hypothetical protein